MPLDKVELADLGTFPLPVGAFCSSHWFDFHPSGIVAAGFYGGGTQFIDVRKPQDIKSYGHATWGARRCGTPTGCRSTTKAGVMTSKKTNLAYSVDLVRGIDVYRVDLPGSSWDTNVASVGTREQRLGRRRARRRPCCSAPARGGARAVAYDDAATCVRSYRATRGGAASTKWSVPACRVRSADLPRRRILASPV